MTVPPELYRVVNAARGAGLLELADWLPSGRLMLRVRDERISRACEPVAVPAYLAGAIARTANGRRDLPWRYLLDAMEDLAEVWPWTMVEP